MSLYGGKIGGAHRSIAPYDKVVINDVEIPVVTPTADQAVRLYELLNRKNKNVKKHKSDFGVGFYLEQDEEKIGGGPVIVAEWTKTDGDTWRITGETKAIFVEWESSKIAFVIEETGKGFLGTMDVIRRFLKKHF